MNRKLLGIGLASVLGIIGLLLLVRTVGGGGSGGGATADGGAGTGEQAAPAEQMTSVLVANGEVPKGTPVAELTNLVQLQPVPQRLVAADAVTSLERYQGLVTTVDLVAGDQILAGRLSEAEQFSRLVAPVEVPPGMLQVSFQLSPDRALGGQIRAGDRVAMFGTFPGNTAVLEDGSNIVMPAATISALHHVLVTNVQIAGLPETERLGESDDPRDLALAYDSNFTVTVALDPTEAPQAVFMLENAKVWLGAEPEDTPAHGDTLIDQYWIYDQVTGVPAVSPLRP